MVPQPPLKLGILSHELRAHIIKPRKLHSHVCGINKDIERTPIAEVVVFEVLDDSGLLGFVRLG